MVLFPLPMRTITDCTIETLCNIIKADVWHTDMTQDATLQDGHLEARFFHQQLYSPLIYIEVEVTGNVTLLLLPVLKFRAGVFLGKQSIL